MSPREGDERAASPSPLAPSTEKAEKVDFKRRDSVEMMLLSACELMDDEDAEHCMRPSDLADLRKLDGNDFCIDCGKMNPDWASISLGIFMCLDCSGQHR